MMPFKNSRMLAAVFAMAISGAWPAVGAERSPAMNYLLRCSGCHDADGSGLPSAGIPPFPGFISAFASDEDGRTYMLHVPGVVASGLDDKEISAVLNYVLDRWGNDRPGVARFTPDEVTTRRAKQVDDIVVLRRAIAKRLVANGVSVADYPWP